MIYQSKCPQIYVMEFHMIAYYHTYVKTLYFKQEFQESLLECHLREPLHPLLEPLRPLLVLLVLLDHHHPQIQEWMRKTFPYYHPLHRQILCWQQYFQQLLNVLSNFGITPIQIMTLRKSI